MIALEAMPETNPIKSTSKQKKKQKNAKVGQEEAKGGDMPDSKSKKKSKRNKETTKKENRSKGQATVDFEKPKSNTKKRRKELKEASIDTSLRNDRQEKAEVAPRTCNSSMSTSQASLYCKEHSITIDDPKQGVFLPLAKFDDTGLSLQVMSCCSNFDSPTPIQAQCWPILLAGRDCIGVAETGSGKTLAFSLPSMAHVQNQTPLGKLVATRGPIVLVLSPTRELAMQSAVVCADAGKNCGQRTVCIYGGGDRSQQVAELVRGAHTIVATPGRLLGYIREGIICLQRVSYLVLDEADRMLDLGFKPDIHAIIDAIGTKSRQTVMFSATWPMEIQKLANEFLRDPVRVTIGSDELSANSNVTQIVEVVDAFKRDTLVDGLLRKYHDGTNRLIIFVLYKKEAIRVEGMLNRKGFHCTALHGDKSQIQRTSSLADFKSGKIPLLVATDVAARGLDIPKVEYVINYSFPLTIEDYIHRIGRTGRAGSKGIAHTFFTTADKSHSGELMNVLKDAGSPVPPDLLKFSAGVKKKQHALYGAHFKADNKPMAAASHVKF